MSGAALTPEQKYLAAVEKLNTLAKLIAEREAEREAKLRDSECEKIMAMSEQQITALTRMQGSNPDDVAKIGKMACDLALKDVAIQRLEADLAACKRDAELLDWLDQNIFNRENTDWVTGEVSKTHSMWVMFSPIGAQGSARRIIDAAMAAGEKA